MITHYIKRYIGVVCAQSYLSTSYSIMLLLLAFLNTTVVKVLSPDLRFRGKTYWLFLFSLPLPSFIFHFIFHPRNSMVSRIATSNSSDRATNFLQPILFTPKNYYYYYCGTYFKNINILRLLAEFLMWFSTR